MTKRQLLQIGLYSASAALLLFVGVRASMGSATANGTIAYLRTPGEPYTAVLEEVLHGADGSSHVASYQTFAQRSDGSRLVGLGREIEGREISFADGTRVITAARLKRKSTTRRTTKPLTQRSPDADCVAGGETLVRRGTIQGTPVAYVRSQDPSRDGEAVYGLRLACAILGRNWSHADGGRGQLRLVSLVLGEPKPALFAIGADYQEGPPSFVGEEDHPHECDNPCQAKLQAFWAKRDASYQKNRVAGPK